MEIEDAVCLWKLMRKSKLVGFFQNWISKLMTRLQVSAIAVSLMCQRMMYWESVLYLLLRHSLPPTHSPQFYRKKIKPDLSEVGVEFILNVFGEGVGHGGGGWKVRDDLNSSWGCQSGRTKRSLPLARPLLGSCFSSAVRSHLSGSNSTALFNPAFKMLHQRP